ncbi:MAG: cyclophilin-like fold protein [Bacteroides sp.]|nr:cyclophilin-like fold protein [Eubacterium sp.]MCM1463651.1 cyclophilin-like fold protein [Bacteroides sp.]
MKKKTLLISAFALAVLLTGCSGTNSNESGNNSTGNSVITSSRTDNVSDSGSDSTSSEAPSAPDNGSAEKEDGNTAPSASETELEVRFGDDGAAFTLHLYDNPTAAAIARHVGTSDWRLPIYHYDDYENWEVMQYYDIPSRYEIPSNPETITSEKAGEVYYSEPNRIILFYGDAEVENEYTRVGYFDLTEEFVSAVKNNPVLEGWGNKIVLISSMG